MKKIYALLIVTFFTLSLSAQEIPIDIVERVNNVDYIFEGEVINSEPYYTNNGQYIHTSNTVNITKRLKGDIECGTIEIITIGGDMGTYSVHSSHTLELSLGSTGIFLCTDTDRPVSVIDYYPETNPEKLEASYENQSFIRYWWDGQGINASDLWSNYDSLALVYNATEAITGLTYIDCVPTNNTLNTGNNSPYDEIEKVVFPTYSQETFDSSIEYIEHKKRHYTRSDRANDKIFYNIANRMITGTTTKYLEFDITVKDDYGFGYLDLSAVRLEYDDQVFGSNVVANNNIIVTRGSLNHDPNCYSDPSPSDVGTGNTVLITALETVYSQCKAPITTTAQSIMHVKMEMLDCDTPSDIALVDTATFIGPSLILLYSAYSDFPADTFSTEYEFLEHNQIQNVPPCKATITDFYPKDIAGGTGEVFTIKGFQFGATIGSGNVFFKNADDGGTSQVYVDTADIQWSDTLITFEMPNYSYDSIGINNPNPTSRPPGTGTFKVFADDGTFDESDQEVNIKYSVINHVTKEPFVVAPRTSFNQKFTFHCDTSVANYDNGAMKAVIDKALRDWSCLTGMNWTLGSDTAYTGSGPLNDSLCIIKFTSYFNGALATSKTYRGQCGNEIVYFENDISIDSNYTWFCDTTGAPVPFGSQDFYSVILHELGHSHHLDHVNDLDAVMYHASQLTTSGSRKINLSQDLSCDEGGNWVMDFTENPSNQANCTGSTNMLRLPNACSNLGFFEHSENNMSYKVYPNPVSQKLYVDIEVGQEYFLNISLIDILGRTIIEENKTVYTGSNSLGIDIGDIPQGMYMLVITSKDGSIHSSLKILKDE